MKLCNRFLLGLTSCSTGTGIICLSSQDRIFNNYCCDWYLLLTKGEITLIYWLYSQISVCRCQETNNSSFMTEHCMAIIWKNPQLPVIENKLKQPIPQQQQCSKQHPPPPPPYAQLLSQIYKHLMYPIGWFVYVLCFAVVILQDTKAVSLYSDIDR